MTRQFQVGDRVRVVAVKPGSALSGRHKVGDVGVVARVSNALSAPTLTLTGSHDIEFWADQFELVPDDEYVALPDGTVALVEEVTAGGAKRVNGIYYDPAKLTPAAAPKSLPEVPADADTMLRMIDVFLARQDGPACDLQRVLAALRGPDESSKSKASTTVPIRCAALPECAKRAGEETINHCTYMSFTAQPFALPELHSVDHFDTHIISAAGALARMGRKVV